ncbi:MAG: SEC-C domain-containing protein, partial [Thermoanaerobaculales bacterium]|nr:SEC-C domain-containing protein [Thermoanaerobaculales bacterium]
VCASGLSDLGRHLPASADEVVAVLETAIEAGDREAFTSLLLAALAVGHEIDASILRNGLALTRDPLSLAIAVGHLRGNPVDVILEVVHGGHLDFGQATQALMLAALWCRQRGLELPTGIITEARLLGRRPGSPDEFMFLLCIAQEIDDDGLWEVLGGRPGSVIAASTETTRKSLASVMTEPVLDSVPQEPPPLVHSGFTVRRAVARVGRNEPCPCGSGRKYKKCCYANDQKRLSNPSEVAGVTRDEMRKKPKQHLNRERLWAMDRHELTRLDPNEIPADLVPMLLNQLLTTHEHRAVFRLFEAIGWSPDLADLHLNAVEMAAMDGESELVRNLMAMRPADSEPVDDLSLAARLAINGDQPGPMLRAVEDDAQRALRDAHGAPVDLAHALLDCGCPGLGVLVARGVIPITDLFEGEVLLENLLKARDRLNLSPSDPIEEISDTLLARSEDRADSAQLRSGLVAKQKNLDEQDKEIAGLRAQLARLNHEIKARRSEPQAVEHAAPTISVEPMPDVDPEIRELRRRLATVKTDLKQRHSERNELRRAVENMRGEMEDLRSEGIPEATVVEEDDGARELGLLLPAESMQSHPLRLVEFGPRFRSDLESSPKRVARSAMRLVGGLCSGDPQAFSDACRIKLDRTLWRARVGLKYRILFRLGSDTVEVLSLVPRSELERTITSLV